MLTQETKRKIDSARQILVGKVPDPKAQVEQITTALIYKFMDDMDKEAIELGGKARFFTNGFQKYAWTKLLDSKLGGHERLELYGEAVAKMSQNPHIPQLFRDIFKDAFLPYRSPETLTLFLKEINGFTYDHSEDLGNAFEYLLSILGSQGDAGQFRTPRHIIDFIVDVLEPKKSDTILDPACGTAGFLISAYKNILKQQKDKPLTPDEKKKLANNLVGYDISPDMVKLSKVNMYLHGFADPKIFEYDTLSSDEKWGESYDVILANPPFFSAKEGSLQPHKRFGIQSKKSEVLFVDYIKEHLRPNGRAGIIVPEGIIFQSSGAYKQLRKMLIEDGLFAVVSLPAGVFNPYSAVKTSVLFFDNALSKKTDKVLFVRVSNDGFDLGAQRRPIDKNDLVRPDDEIDATKVLKGQRVAIETGKKNPWIKKSSTFGYEISKKQILQSADYSLSAERYRLDNLDEQKYQKWPIVNLGDVCEITSSKRVFESEWETQGVPFYRAREIVKLTNQGFVNNELYISEEMFLEYSNKYGAPKEGDLMVTGVGTLGICYLVKNGDRFYFKDGNIIWLRNFSKKINSNFLKYLFDSAIIKDQIRATAIGGTVGTYTITNAKNTKIPLPPIEIQKEIVEQIEIKQNAIGHAKAIIKNLERERRYFGKSLRKLNDIKMSNLGDICINMDSKRKPVTKSDRSSGKYPYYGASGIVDYVDDYIFNGDYLLVSEDGANLLARSTPIAFSIFGKTWVNNHAHILKFEKPETQRFVEHYLNSIDLKQYITGSAQPKLNQDNLNKIQIPLPSLEVQKQMVDEIEKEEEVISANQQLIKIMEKKIAVVLSGL